MGTIEFSVHKNLKCVHFKGSGDISYDYLIQRIIDVNRHPDFDTSFNTFVDFEDAVVSAKMGGFDRYEAFFRNHQENANRRKWAIYSANPETLQNANMAHLTRTKEISVDVFDNRAEALRFLGLGENDL